MVVQRIENRRGVAIVQGISVAHTVILTTQRGPPQGVDIGVAMIAGDAGRARRGRRLRANGTLLALNVII